MGSNEPDPNPVELSLKWGGDLELDANGDLLEVSGIEKCRQRIIRRYFTCPEETEPGAGYIPADYLFDPDYGFGATRLVGEPTDSNIAAEMQAKLKQAILVDESVDSTQNPIIKLFVAPSGEVWANVQVFLTDATKVALNFPIQR